MSKFAVAGITGNTGRVVAETLLAQGHQVRALVRDASKAPAGVEAVVAPLDDVAAVTRALEGVDGAYLLLPPTASHTDPLAQNAALADGLAQAVRASKVPHVVLLSSVGAQHETGTGQIATLHHAEQALAATGAAVTAVRAAYFMDNLGASLAALPHGILPGYVRADQSLPMVSTKDIGRTAARALAEGGSGFQVIELSGPREYTANEIAAALSKLVGKEITAHVEPPAAVEPAFIGYGFPPKAAALFRGMYEGIASGRVGFGGGSARAVRGTVTIEEALRDLLAR